MKNLYTKMKKTLKAGYNLLERACNLISCMINEVFGFEAEFKLQTKQNLKDRLAALRAYIVLSLTIIIAYVYAVSTAALEYSKEIKTIITFVFILAVLFLICKILKLLRLVKIQGYVSIKDALDGILSFRLTILSIFTGLILLVIRATKLDETTQLVLLMMTGLIILSMGAKLKRERRKKKYVEYLDYKRALNKKVRAALKRAEDEPSSLKTIALWRAIQAEQTHLLELGKHPLVQEFTNRPKERKEQ